MTDVSDRFSFDPFAQQVVVHTGKVEIGQNIHHAFKTIVANSLNIHPERVRVSPISTLFSPDDGLTVGSLSMQVTGSVLKEAALSLKAELYKEASAELGSVVDEILIDQHTLEFVSRNKRCSLFELPTTRVSVVKEHDRKRDEYNSSITAAVTGNRQYIQDLVLPEMLHGRALRGRNIALDNTDDISIIRHDGFSAAVAKTEAALNRVWAKVEKELLDRDASCDGPVGQWIQQQPVCTKTTGETSPINSSVFQSATRPFLLHASIAPSCAIALYSKGVLEIWTHSQGIFPLRDTIAKHLDLQTHNVIVRHVPSAGCYGHNAADDAVMDAVLISLQFEGSPIRVIWTRQEEFQHSPVGAAMHVEIEAQLSIDNKIESWRQTIWSCPHAQRPGGAGQLNLLATIEQDSKNKSTRVYDLPDDIGGGASRNALPPYTIKSSGITTHIVQDLPVRTSSLRGLGAQMNVVGIEATMDKLAKSCQQDPIAFRVMNLDDPRACSVLQQLGKAVGDLHDTLTENESIGIAYSRYKNKAAFAAVAARIRLDEQVELLEVWAMVDAGHIVDHSGTVNQIEGGIIQATSWTLREGVLLRDGYIDAAGWDDYPIVGWSDIPNIHIELVSEKSDQPYLGVGECMVGPVSAAIVNGVSNIAGYTIADLPLTREKFLADASTL